MFLGDEDEPEASDYLASERAAFKAEGQELVNHLGQWSEFHENHQRVIINAMERQKIPSNKPKKSTTY